MSLPISSPEFHDSLLILGSAGLVIPAVHRLRINPVIGFILIGIMVGPYGLGSLADHWPSLRWLSIREPETVAVFSEIGVILLLFMIGLELSFERLKSMQRLVLGLGSAEVSVIGLLIAVGLWLFDAPVHAAITLGIALAFSSTALVLPIVGMTGNVGRLAFAMLLFEDLALVPLLFIIGALGAQGDSFDIISLLETLGIGTLAVVALILIGRRLVPPLFRQAARTKSPELFMAASLVVVMGASIITTIAGLSPIVGALIAGLLIAETEYHRQVEITIEPFKGLALGVFLISIGMSINVADIIANPLAIIAALVAVLAVKALIVILLMRISGAAPGISRHLGLLMASPSETSLIIIAAAVQVRLITQDTASFWQIVTALGLTATPFLAQWGKAAERRAIAEASDRETQTSDPTAPPRVVIAGFGRVGRLVADMLSRHDIPYIAIDSNIDTVGLARAEGLPVIFGDTGRIEMISRLDLGHARALVITMNDPHGTEAIVRGIRQEYPDLTIIARAQDSKHAARLYKVGVTDAVPETVESSLQLAEATLVDLGRPMGLVIASIHEKRAELRAQILAHAPDQQIREPLPRRHIRDYERNDSGF